MLLPIRSPLPRHSLLFSVLFCLCVTAGSAYGSEIVDQVQFGEASAEKSHDLSTERGDRFVGALDLPALRLMPPRKKGWRGGTVTFTMKVDPDQPNYFSAKFWGSELTGEDSRLMLFMDGKQIGQRHLGEVEQLDIAGHEPRFNERFFYKTMPLPMKMTRGKKTVEFTIEAQGPVNGYGRTIEGYQLDMTKPSRGLYRGYVHTEPFLTPDSSEVQGEPITSFPVSDRKPKITIEQFTDKVNDRAMSLLKGKNRLGVEDLHFLAIMYHEPWSVAYQKPEFVEKIAKNLDNVYRSYLKDKEKDGIGKRWVGYGPAGEAAHLMSAELQPFLKTKAEGTKISRAEAWGTMFKASLDYHSTRRRNYTNQSLILDTNLYRANSGLKAVAPRLAWPEAKALRLLKEAIGLEPWSGSLDKKGRPTWSAGRDHYLLTKAAMTRELGYVGEYGESVFDLALHVYLATKPTYDAPGDPEIKAQMIKLSKARAVFRYPMADEYGNQAMRLETVIGWRDWKFPGKVTYDQRPGRDGGPLDVSVASMDPELIGYSQQMFRDKQVLPWLAKRAEDSRGAAMLANAITIGSYHRILAMKPSPHKLPTTAGEPDFVFGDPGIGVVAFKHGDDVLFTSLYWRARYAINNLARVHHLTPQIQRDATVRIETRFKDSGKVFTVPNQTNEPFNTRHEKFYQGFGFSLASAGDEQPIAYVPKDQKDWKPGKENAYAGKGDFYLMTYGPYLIAQNCSDKKEAKFEVPEAFMGATNVATGEAIDAKLRMMRLPAEETVVLFRK